MQTNPTAHFHAPSAEVSPVHLSRTSPNQHPAPINGPRNPDPDPAYLRLRPNRPDPFVNLILLPLILVLPLPHLPQRRERLTRGRDELSGILIRPPCQSRSRCSEDFRGQLTSQIRHAVLPDARVSLNCVPHAVQMRRSSVEDICFSVIPPTKGLFARENRVNRKRGVKLDGRAQSVQRTSYLPEIAMSLPSSWRWGRPLLGV